MPTIFEQMNKDLKEASGLICWLHQVLISSIVSLGLPSILWAPSTLPIPLGLPHLELLTPHRPAHNFWRPSVTPAISQIFLTLLSYKEMFTEHTDDLNNFFLPRHWMPPFSYRESFSINKLGHIHPEVTLKNTETWIQQYMKRVIHHNPVRLF